MGAKGLTNSAGHKQLEPILLSQLKNVVQPLDVDPHGQWDVAFPDSTQKSAEMDQPVNAVVDDDLLKVFEVQDVSINVWPCKNTAGQVGSEMGHLPPLTHLP